MAKTDLSTSETKDVIVNELNMNELNLNDYFDEPTKEDFLDSVDIDLDSDDLCDDIPSVGDDDDIQSVGDADEFQSVGDADDILSVGDADDIPSIGDADDIPSVGDVDEVLQSEEIINEGSTICTNEVVKQDVAKTPAQTEGSNLPMDEITIDYPDDFEEYLDSDQIRTILHECSTCNGMFISDAEYESHSCQIAARNKTIGQNVSAVEPGTKNVIINLIPTTVESSEPKKPGINVIRKHLRKPKNGKPVKRVTKSKDKLSVRARSDHGHHICHICDKALSRRSSLMIHMRRHTGETPFECDYCQKKFVVLYDLDRHMLTHMGEKKYSCYCDVCRKPFVSKSGMIQHMRIHHGSFTVHPCDVCGLTFPRKSKLLTHKISHQSKKVMLDILNAKQSNVQLLLLYDNKT